MALIAVAAVLVLAVTLLGGRQRLFVDHVVVSVMGLLLISPALVIGGYQFLNGSEELERYRGKSLWLRAGICALAYVVLWGLFIFVLGYVSGPFAMGKSGSGSSWRRPFSWLARWRPCPPWISISARGSSTMLSTC
jgi:hypothetical protein